MQKLAGQTATTVQAPNPDPLDVARTDADRKEARLAELRRESVELAGQVRVLRSAYDAQKSLAIVEGRKPAPESRDLLESEGRLKDVLAAIPVAEQRAEAARGEVGRLEQEKTAAELAMILAANDSISREIARAVVAAIEKLAALDARAAKNLANAAADAIGPAMPRVVSRRDDDPRDDLRRHLPGPHGPRTYFDKNHNLPTSAAKILARFGAEQGPFFAE